MSRLLDPGAPIEVDVDVDIPRHLRFGSRRLDVTAVLARWRVETDWWRAPLSREYWRLDLGELVVEAYLDRASGEWRLTRLYD